jgi:hypothetical protein
VGDHAVALNWCEIPIAPVAAGITGPPTPTHLGTTTNIYVKNVDADAVRAMRALEKSVRLIVALPSKHPGWEGLINDWKCRY